MDDFGGRVGGRGGGQQRLLESDRNWQESAESIPNALLPARGAADLKAPPHVADPNIDIIGRQGKIWFLLRALAIDVESVEKLYNQKNIKDDRCPNGYQLVKKKT